MYDAHMNALNDIEKKFKTYTVGCLVKFEGEDWFEGVSDKIGFVSKHDRENDAIEIIVGERNISVFVDEFSYEELSVYQNLNNAGE